MTREAGYNPIALIKSILLRWFVLTLAVVVAAAITQSLGLPMSARVNGLGDVINLFVGSAALAFLNATLGRILKILSIPLRCLTLGLFSLVINAAILWLAGSMGFGFTVGSFGAAFVGSLILSAANGVLTMFLVRDPGEKDD